MKDFVILELWTQIREPSKQIDQMKKTMEDSPCFDGSSLDATIYLDGFNTLEDYKECSYKESFLIVTQKLQGYVYY